MAGGELSFRIRPVSVYLLSCYGIHLLPAENEDVVWPQFSADLHKDTDKSIGKPQFSANLHKNTDKYLHISKVREMKDGKQQQTQYEVDFIATNGQEKYYIQSAYRIDDETKREQELQSLKRIDDSFRKVVIVGDDIAPWTDENGITYIGLLQFLQKGLQS